ncbi:MAG: AbrB/MazE/SpoVT family DNA-binding domain-containing protein [Thermomicrobiales bacterium]
MSTTVKVSSKYQIAVPSAVRKKLGIERGDRLIIEVREGYAVLKPESLDAVARLKGLHSEIWDGIDAQEYVNQERNAWED